ncbi:MAG: branched-chain amino acid ABC transporter permease [Alphaproteobacteria bacterium]
MSAAGLDPSTKWARASAVVAGVFILIIPFTGYSPLIIGAIDTYVLALFVLSLNLLVGYGGMISMGHAAFFAVGGYAAGLLAKFYGVPMYLAFPLAPVAAGLLALVIGFLSVRLTHAYFIMLTLAFAQLVYTVLWKWNSVTGGDDGLIGFAPPGFLRDNNVYYYFVVVVVGICGFALYRICNSPFGQILTAIRDNPDRTSFIGVNVHAKQLAAFVIAGAFAGVAGALQAYFHRGMFVNSAHFVTSADALVILLLGGSRYFIGPVVGAVLFKILVIAIPNVTVYWPFFLGLVILAVALFVPDGLMKLTERLKPRVARHVR